MLTPFVGEMFCNRSPFIVCQSYINRLPFGELRICLTKHRVAFDKVSPELAEGVRANGNRVVGEWLLFPATTNDRGPRTKERSSFDSSCLGLLSLVPAMVMGERLSEDNLYM